MLNCLLDDVGEERDYKLLILCGISCSWLNSKCSAVKQLADNYYLIIKILRSADFFIILTFLPL